MKPSTPNTVETNLDALGHVAVIAGGLSHEREISLRSGRRMLRELTAAGVSADIYEADHDLLARLKNEGVTAALSTLHGDIGEDGSIQTLLELSGIPFIGTASGACRLAWDKTTARVLHQREGLPVPTWASLPSSTLRELGPAVIIDALLRRISPPLVVKPNRGGSVLGVSGVTDRDNLSAALMRCFAYDTTAIVEGFVNGIDVSVAVVDNNGTPSALPPVSLLYDREHQFDFAARYNAGLIHIDAPAKISDTVRLQIQAAAVTAHDVLGLRDFSRSDFLVRPDDSFVLLETAITPGFTETSLFPFAVEASGERLGTLMRRLLASATNR